jgi:Fe-S-cluster-containing dehydrogenase component
MAPTRREFLKAAGVSAVGLTVSAGLARAAAVIEAPAAPAPPPATPASPPAEGRLPLRPLTARRWAMVVEPRRCPPGCTDCIAACHRAHNVPDFGNPKDDVHWIALEPLPQVLPALAHPRLAEAVRTLPLLVLCNHCENPPCVRVCPTKATFQRPDGIVMMDYHRCIGCRFCMAACPYGARSMNYRDPRPFIPRLNPDFPTRAQGVVEKCNFCEERLARGILPACVAACRQKALTFGDLDDPRSAVRSLLGKSLSLRRRPELGTGPQVYYIL